MKQNSTLFDTISHSCKEQLKAQGKRNFAFKILVFIALYTAMIMNSVYDISSPQHVPECIRDETHEATRGLAQFLGENQLYRNILIITASLLMDLNVVVLSFRWFLFERNFKLLFVILAFYAFRGFLQRMFFMRFPDDYVWGHPGLFSLSVAYAPANDFFFSGHCGMCTIIFIHFKRHGLKTMTRIALFTIIIEFFTLLVTRAHYFIDLVVGIIIAHYIYLISDWLQEWYNNRELKNVKQALINNGVKAEESKQNLKEKKKPENNNF